MYINHFLHIIIFYLFVRTMPEKDFYDILGVSSKANENEIKKAYRSLSLKYHPDRNQEPGSTQKFQEISDAYETLSDNSKRKAYDMQKQFGGLDGNNPFGPFGPGGFPFPGGAAFHMHPGGMPPGHGADHIEEIFEQFFGGGGLSGFPGAKVHMTSMHSNRGGPSIRVFHNGHDVFPPRQAKPPLMKKNVNISLEDAYNGKEVHFEIERNPDQPREPCTIPIQKGVVHGQTLIAKEKGVVQNNVKGDLEITILIDEHPLFRRNDNDLHYTCKISLKEALCGFMIEISHVNGKTLRMSNNNQIISPGYKRIIQNFGMPYGNDKYGNLVIEFEIIFPTNLTD